MSSKTVEKVTSGIANIALDKMMAPKQENGKLGTPINVLCNAYKLDIDPKIPFFKYDVDIVLQLSTEKEVSLTKTKNKDSELLVRYEQCSKIFKYVLRAHREFFTGRYFYNRQALLYTQEKLKIQPDETKCFDVPLTEFQGDRNGVDKLLLRIQCVSEEFEIDPDVRKTAKTDPEQNDLRLLEGLNNIISAPVFDGNNLLKYANNILYVYDNYAAGFTDRDAPSFPSRPDLYVGIGINAAVKTLGGRTGHKMFLITDVAKTVFHNDGYTLMQKFTAINDGRPIDGRMTRQSPGAVQLLKGVKGLEVLRNYGKFVGMNTPTFTIGGFGPAASDKTATVVVDGKKMTIAEYFLAKYNIRLKYPDLFTVYQTGRKENRFPVEVLLIANSQRATTEQLPPMVQAEVVKTSATLPSQRLSNLKKLKTAALIDKAPGEVGIKIAAQMAQLKARQLSLPPIKAGQVVASVKDNSSWEHKGRYQIAATVRNWEFYVIGARPGDFDGGEYLKRLSSCCGQKGMKVEQPKTFNIQKRPSEQELEKMFTDAKKEGTRFMFFIDNDNFNLHALIKKFEQKHQILTQNCRLSKCKLTLAKNQRRTLENVVHKINMKHGGLNFEVHDATRALLDPKLLVLGFETSRSTSSSVPGVIGYSVNSSTHPQMFVGGYKFFQREKQDKEAYSKVLEEVLVKAINDVKQNRKVQPERLIIYFNGLTDGLLGHANELYNKNIRAAIAATKVNLTWLTLSVTKSHSERFYRSEIPNVQQAAAQNIPPGLVVDDLVVSPVFTEFYLNAHLAFQGTAKTPKYTILTNTSKHATDYVQGVTHALCTLHQIVTSTTSLPTPVVVADRYAKRGGNNFAEHRSGGSVFSGDSGEFDISELNMQLTYNNKPLSVIRFNA